ncbi:MAG: sulfite exporter TauE/SafE family protein [Nitrospirota bacterium]|jgi:uncharacterized membrane protein YfcA
MYFPVAGIEVSPWVPPAVAFGISLVTSMAGVSGAFLLLPFQISVLGFTTPAVSATNHVFNVVGIPSAVYRYVREGRMVWPLTAAVIAGTVPGVIAGVLVRVRYLPDPRHFKAFVGAVLLYMAWRLMRELVVGIRTPGPGGRSDTPRAVAPVTIGEVRWSRIGYEFAKHQYHVHPASIAALSFVVGLVGGTYGIGGGSILAPYFVSLLSLPVYTIAGAVLMATFATSATAVLFSLAIAPLYPGQAVAPDWRLGLLFGIGGVVGMYCGARMQRWVPGRPLKAMLLLCVVVPAVRYLVGWLR